MSLQPDKALLFKDDAIQHVDAFALVKGMRTLVNPGERIFADAMIFNINFDKTGTLMQGALSVEDVRIDPKVGVSREEFLRLAAAVEQLSEHPLAVAITKATGKAGLPATDFKSLRGLKASAAVAGYERVLFGFARFLNVPGDHGLYEEAQKKSCLAQTVVWVGWAEIVGGFISFKDLLDPTGLATITALTAQKIKVVILSGDSQETTQAIVNELGIADFKGGVSPVEKAGKIQDLKSEGFTVAMIGDGVDDAPALAGAYLIITAMNGTDVAGSSSDIILTRSDLTIIPWLIRISQYASRTVIFNMVWAFACFRYYPLESKDLRHEAFPCCAVNEPSLLWRLLFV